MIWLKGEGEGGKYTPPPPCTKWGSKNFLQNQRGVREQIRVYSNRLGSISFEDSGFCTETSSTSLSNYILEYTDRKT